MYPFDDDNNDNNNNEITFLDIITIFSFILGIENYRLNDQQSNQLMQEMNGTQDNMLRAIIKQNKDIIAQNEDIIKQNETIIKQNKETLNLLKKYL